MIQYSIDELRGNEIDIIRKYLEKQCDKSALGNILWLNIPENYLTPEQKRHRQCAPHVAAVEIMEDAVVFEMLIRSRNQMRCSCIGYASREQRNYILTFVDKMIKETGLKI